VVNLNIFILKNGKNKSLKFTNFPDFCQKKFHFFSQFAKISINEKIEKEIKKDLMKISFKKKTPEVYNKKSG
jgi:hypothetical protein